MPQSNDQKRKEILDRIERIEDAISKAQEYLDTGAHADWKGFRAWFTPKVKDGVELPPHKDWVRNVFLPRKEKTLAKAERLIERFS